MINKLRQRQIIKEEIFRLKAKRKLFKKNLIKENANEDSKNFGFWFYAGVRGAKQIQQTKDLLTQKGIDFKAEGNFGIDFQGKGYVKRDIVQLLRDNNLTRFVIYDHE